MAKKISKIQLFRRIVLGVMLSGFLVLIVLHDLLPNMPSVDSLCPFGGLETLMKWLASGEFLKHITPSNIVLFGAVVVLGIVLSRFFCGWLCAFGALQGVFGWIGKKIFKKRFTVPPKVDRVLRWTKYVILVGIIYFTWKTGELVIRPYDPVAALGHLTAGFAELWAEFKIGLILLILFLGLSMLYERAFCKYACPLGALLAILSRIPIFRIKRDEPTCISCSLCDRACPMNIDVSHADAIHSPECIGCMECVTACPTKKNTLYTTLGGKKTKIWTIIGVGLGIYASAALIGQAAGMLEFTNPTLKQITLEEGTFNLENVKGSTTYAELAEVTGIDAAVILTDVGVDPALVPATTKIKDTGALIGKEDFETDAVRMAIAKRLGIPYTGEDGEGEAVPSEPSPVENPPLEAVQPQASTESTTLQIPAPPPSAQGTVPVSSAAPTTESSPTLKIPEGFTLEGTLTIEETASKLNTTPEQVIEKLGLPHDIPTNKPLRDMAKDFGYTMTELKERIAQ